MKNTLIAAGLTAALSTAAAAEETQHQNGLERAANDVRVLIFGDADECIQESVREQFQMLADATLRGESAPAFIITLESMNLIKSDCEADTNTKATEETQHLLNGVTGEAYLGMEMPAMK